MNYQSMPTGTRADPLSPATKDSPLEPIRYPLSMQRSVVSDLDRLRQICPAAADGVLALRAPARSYSTLRPRERELALLAGFAAGRNEGGFRVHCLRAQDEGVTLPELEQVVLLMLGTSLALAPTVETLTWLHDELA